MFNNYNYFPFQGFQPRFSLFSRLRGLNFSEILNGTQKTLNVVNQAIPIFYQIRPLWNNTKTIFKIANAINEDDKGGQKDTNANVTSGNNLNKEQTKETSNTIEKSTNSDQPIFFL